jgi:hypothetical protein
MQEQINTEIDKLSRRYITGDTSKGFGIKIDIRLRPYDYFLEYLRKINQENLIHRGIVSSDFVRVLKNALENSEVIEIDKRLVPMIEGTDDEIFYRPMFFETIFINTDFHIGEFILKGLILLDGMEYAAQIEDWFIISCAVHKDGHGIFLFTQLLEEPIRDYGGNEINKAALKIHKHMRNMACVFIDLVMMNDSDLEVITIKPTKQQQEKRERYKRPKIPAKVYIRPRKNFIKYLEEYNSEDAKSYSHRFRVRGTIRHYRHDRYTEERRKKPQFIKPFFKGRGILIQKKRYKVMPP